MWRIFAAWRDILVQAKALRIALAASLKKVADARCGDVICAWRAAVARKQALRAAGSHLAARAAYLQLQSAFQVRYSSWPFLLNLHKWIELPLLRREAYYSCTIVIHHPLIFM